MKTLERIDNYLNETGDAEMVISEAIKNDSDAAETVLDIIGDLQDLREKSDCEKVGCKQEKRILQNAMVVMKDLIRYYK